MYDDAVGETTYNIMKILYLVWISICILPNGLLAFILAKYELCRSNFYFAIANWSLANIFQMMDAICIAAVPEKYMSHNLVIISRNINCTILTIPVTLATCFIYDRFIKSKKICRFIVYNIWISTVINILLTIFSVIYGYETTLLIMVSIGAIGLLALLNLIVKSIMFLVKQPEGQNYPIRLIMSSICIVTNFAYVIYLIVFHLDVIDVSTPYLYSAFTTLVFTNGLLNFWLLYTYDSVVKSKIRQLFRCSVKEYNMEFTPPKETEQNSGSPDSAINIE